MVGVGGDSEIWSVARLGSSVGVRRKEYDVVVLIIVFPVQINDSQGCMHWSIIVT